jgi:hypothetical protein
MSKVVIYDIECFPDLFTITFKERDTKIIKQFAIHAELKDDYHEMMEYISTITNMIGFNNLNYDYPLLHSIIMGEVVYTTPGPFVKALYLKSTEIINNDWSAIAPWDVKISQLDLFRIHHFDNKAKRTSLKWVEFVMWFHNVEDLKWFDIYTIEDIDKVLSYNLNDVEATEMFYYLSKGDIDLRKDLQREFGIPLMNANEPKIGSDIFLNEIAKRTRRDIRDIKDLRTYRDYVLLDDIIVPYAGYESEEMNRFLAYFRQLKIYTTKTDKEYPAKYKGFTYDFGLGGIHGCTKPGIYKTDDQRTIYSIDVASYYPNIAISNKFSPEHLGETFYKIYSELYERRKEGKRLKLNTLVSGLKLALNGTFGKSGEANSFLYDIKFLLSITINGQILLTMLSEKLQRRGFELLMINTDGMELYVPSGMEEEFVEVCKQWEALTGLELEFNKYEKMVIRDVNNYMAITQESETFEKDINWKNPTFIDICRMAYSKKYKFKGIFEIAKTQNGKVVYNKNWSQLIVPIALFNYFAYNRKVEETILHCENIFVFCCGLKLNGNSIGEIRYIEGDSLKSIKLSKTTRYYISNKGYYLNKEFESGRESKVKKGYKITLMNRYKQYNNFLDYDVNYIYYIRECYKIIDVVDTKQLSLFN